MLVRAEQRWGLLLYGSKASYEDVSGRVRLPVNLASVSVSGRAWAMLQERTC